MSSGPINTDPVWVESNQQLAELCHKWRQQAAVAIDTEFMRTTTFYPQAALFQVGDGRGCYLLDPLSITDFSPFAELCRDPAVVKVLHACSEDLEVFKSFLQVVPAPLFDTQVAAAFTGIGFSLGYARLVEALLAIELPKSETRSDWLQRPLSQSQLHYAAVDVAYLLVVYGKLLQQLKASGRLEWVRTDCQQVVTIAEQELDFDEYYLKIKNAWRLNRRELAILQKLCAWREQQARARDIPRNRLIKEHTLWDMAKHKPQQLAQLANLDGMPSRTVRMDGEQLLELIAAVQALPAEQLPPLLDTPLPPAVGEVLQDLKQTVRTLAETLQIAPEVLVRKRDYEALLRAAMVSDKPQLPSSLAGWREQVVGQTLLAQVTQWAVATKQDQT